MGRTDDRFAAATFAERARLAELFTDLGPEEWATASLCAGWRTREVLAHLTMPFRIRTLGFLGGMIRARLRFDRFADRDARTTAAARGDAALVELYRANIRHPWQPPGGGQAGALGHELIHGLDITEPLGLPAPPPERIAMSLESTRSRQLAYFGVDLAGRRLEATDADCSIGEGEPLRLSARELLLVVTGRRALSDGNQEVRR